MDTISRARAAAAVTAARAIVLAKAEVPTPPHSAAEWAFTRLYDALAENLLASGRSNVAVTYRELALLASDRGEGKKIAPSSLRKPFSEKMWRGDLLDEPFQNDGISLILHLHPAGQRGRPLTLTASFTKNGESVSLERATPDGRQPIVEACRRADARTRELREQSHVASRLVHSLRDAGFAKADKLSRWFERHGLHVAPSVILVILLFALVTASAAAAYLLFRYASTHDVMRLRTDPRHQGNLPPGHTSDGVLVEVSPEGGARLEHRVRARRHIVTYIDDSLPFTRRYPDSEFRFDWQFRVGSEVTKASTTLPEIELPTIAADAQPQVRVLPVETLRYEMVVHNDGDSKSTATQGIHLTPGRDERLVVDSTSKGWLDGIMAVPPLPHYQPTRRSPISAAMNGRDHVTFTIRHGPVRGENTALKVVFGDGTAWTSLDRPWHPITTAPGDYWDRFETVIDHRYTTRGQFPVEVTLFQKTGTAWTAHRHSNGTVFVATVLPTHPPEAPSPFVEQLTIHKTAHDAVSDVELRVPAPKGKDCAVPLPASPSGVTEPEIFVQPCGTDPLTVAVAVLLERVPRTTSCSECRMTIDFGDGGPQRPMERRTPHYLAGGEQHEYIRSGSYLIVARSYDHKSGVPIQEVRTSILVSADHPVMSGR
jgi:hypothetical protein